MPKEPTAAPNKPFEDRSHGVLGLLQIEDLAKEFNVTTTTVWRWVRKGVFPKPFYVTAAAPARWRTTVIVQWLDKQQGQRHRPFWRGVVKQQMMERK